MISQANQDAGRGVELGSDATSTDQLMPSGPIRNVVDETPRSLLPEQAAIPSTPKVVRIGDGRALEAYVERRRKLAARIRVENPSCTEEEIEARLEQFGA